MENHYFQWINHDKSTIHGNFPVRKLLVYQRVYFLEVTIMIAIMLSKENDSDHCLGYHSKAKAMNATR